MRPLLICVCFFFVQARAQEKAIVRLYALLQNAGDRFRVPELALGYEENFSAIQSIQALESQQRFFDSLHTAFQRVSADDVTGRTLVLYKTLAFEIPLHKERVRLSMLWKTEDSHTLPGGLHSFPHGQEWYSYFVKRFTGLDVTPADVFDAGAREVEKAKAGIDSIRKSLGYESESSFYSSLSAEKHLITDKDSIVALFHDIDRRVREGLPALFEPVSLPRVEPMEWPGATATTPPGIYLGKQSNPYGVDVFQFNFFEKRFRRRCMEWLYLHEAIPGHHLQSRYFNPDRPFYFGTSEGWACYVEKLGSALGLYRDIYMRLGEKEWDLVRSARLVMEVGIHYFGWSRAKTKQYWVANIPGQDEIAEREISRITAWPGQALCYKMGARAIQEIIAKSMTTGSKLASVHTLILQSANLPLQALM